MVNRPPQRNMPASMTPWGQWVESQIGGMQSSSSINNQSIDRALAGINASLTAISEQQRRILETQQYMSSEFDITVYPNGALMVPVMTLDPPEWARFGLVTASVSNVSHTPLDPQDFMVFNFQLETETLPDYPLSVTVDGQSSGLWVNIYPIAIKAKTMDLTLSQSLWGATLEGFSFSGTVSLFINWA